MSKDTSFTVRDLPRSERPHERLQKFGPEALSAQELLALVIGRGIPKKSVMNIAQELLAKFVIGALRRAKRPVLRATLHQCDGTKRVFLSWKYSQHIIRINVKHDYFSNILLNSR